MSRIPTRPGRKVDEDTKRLDASRVLSPRRNSTRADSVEALADEQLRHFGIDPGSDYGRVLRRTAVDRMVRDTYLRVHERYAGSMAPMATLVD